MSDDATRAATASLTRLRIAFATLSVALLVVLGIAPATTYFSEWRAVQQRYNALARRAKLAPIDVRIRQIASPVADVVDRCGSCHLGAIGIPPLAGDPLFAAHPPIPHDPTRFGCTVCHGGQGRAVTARAAHGAERNWEEPLFPRPYREAGCGTCHSHLQLPDLSLVAPGEALFEARGCSACHGVDGRDAAAKRDLSQVGLRGYARDWHERHVRAATGATDLRWAASPLPLEPAERTAIDAYLSSRVGAPKLMSGKLLATRSCRGCHRIGGVGGDGPDLSDVGGRSPSDLDFSRLPGERTLAAWLTAVVTDPSRVNPDARMPALGLDASEVDAVVTYLLSLKTRETSVPFWPRDRVRGLLGERDFAVDGRSLFLTFCSTCHGTTGEGRATARGALLAAPAIGSAAFLAIAGDAFLVRTLQEGRPEHGMPAWGASEGGLRPEEIAAIVRYLRETQPAAPSLDEVRASAPDLPHGRELFQATCAPCHGGRGEGTAIAPPLAAADNLVTMSDSAIYATLLNGVDGTAMGSFRTFDARGLRDLIGAIRALDRTQGPRAEWRPRRGDPERGREIFARRCVTCHGEHAQGRRGPAIGDPRFVATASDSFLTASVVRRHEMRRDEGRRTPDEIADVVAYLRSRSAPDAVPGTEPAPSRAP